LAATASGLLIGVAATIGWLVADRANSESRQANKPPEEVVQLTAVELFDAYGKDVIAADRQYTGKTIELANVQGMVQKDGEGRYYLVAADSMRMVKRADQGVRIMSVREYENNLQAQALNTQYLPGIALYLEPKTAEDFSGLGNNLVTVRGVCKGMKADPKTEPAYFVIVERVSLQRLQR
jgi:hypothetical protein